MMSADSISSLAKSFANDFRSLAKNRIILDLRLGQKTNNSSKGKYTSMHGPISLEVGIDNIEMLVSCEPGVNYLISATPVSYNRPSEEHIEKIKLLFPSLNDDLKSFSHEISKEHLKKIIRLYPHFATLNPKLFFLWIPTVYLLNLGINPRSVMFISEFQENTIQCYDARMTVTFGQTIHELIDNWIIYEYTHACLMIKLDPDKNDELNVSIKSNVVEAFTTLQLIRDLQMVHNDED